jgi:hypothetical protein
MDVGDALIEADDAARYGDSVGPSIAATLAAEVRRLQAMECRAREVAVQGSDVGASVARYILGESS